VQSSKATCTRSATPAAIGWRPDSGRGESFWTRSSAGCDLRR
jgi:hypothetical protein